MSKSKLPWENDYDKKKIATQRAITTIDEYGTVERVVTEDILMVDKEPEYVKVYVDTMLAFQGQNRELTPVIIALGRHMTWANDPSEEFRCTVRTDSFVREDISRVTGLSDPSVLRLIRELKEANILIPIVKDGKTKRGIYFVNPWVMSRGEWKDIKNLRTSFVFTSDNHEIDRAAVIETDGEVQRFLPMGTGEDGQMYLLPPKKGTKGEEDG